VNISTNFLSFWQGGSSRSGDIAEFMSYLTCLTVSVESKSSLETSYHCRVGDGLLTGRKKISVCMYGFFFVGQELCISVGLHTENWFLQQLDVLDHLARS